MAELGPLVALRHIRVGDRFYVPGEVVPEAEDGRNYELMRLAGDVMRAPAGYATPQQPPAPATEDEAKVIEDFAIGGGWYDVPGVGKVQGRDAAVAALKGEQA